MSLEIILSDMYIPSMLPSSLRKTYFSLDLNINMQYYKVLRGKANKV